MGSQAVYRPHNSNGLHNHDGVQANVNRTPEVNTQRGHANNNMNRSNDEEHENSSPQENLVTPITIMRGNVEVMVPGRLRGLVLDRDNYINTRARRISRELAQGLSQGGQTLPLNPNVQLTVPPAMRALRNARDDLSRLLVEIELVGNLS